MAPSDMICRTSIDVASAQNVPHGAPPMPLVAKAVYGCFYGLLRPACQHKRTCNWNQHHLRAASSLFFGHFTRIKFLMLPSRGGNVR